MRVVLTIAVAGSLLAGGAVAAVAGLFIANGAIALAVKRPSFEVRSAPIAAAQARMLGALDIRRPPV